VGVPPVEAEPADAAPVAVVTPHPADAAATRASARDALAVAAVALAFALPLRGLLRAQGPPMEEGFMLVFPELVLKGEIPNRDFLHLYGPGSLWALAGAYKVFGVSLMTERVFGLLQQMAVVFGVYALARPWGRRLAVCCAWISAVILIPFGLTALAWVGAVGLGVIALACGVAARSAEAPRRGHVLALTAGLCFGLALLFRLDLALATALAVAALVWGMAARRRNALFLGLAFGVAPYVIHLATAGPRNVWDGMVIDPVFHLRGGRRLPVPPPWGHLDGFLQRAGALDQLSWPLPSLRTAPELFLWFFLLIAIVAFLLFVAWIATRARPSSRRARTLLVVALFSAGLMPQAIQRVDSAHFAWVGCVPIAFLPVAITEIVRRVAPRVSYARATLVSGVLVVAIVLFVIPEFTARRYADYVAQTFNVHRTAHRIEHDGRVFYYGKKDRADAANAVIAAAARVSKPGDRLVVGTGDLRKTPYSDAYLYYMLPELHPGTYYIEMDPGVANAADSGLAGEIAQADTVILSKIWDDWDEPNDSRKFGSDRPNQVLQQHFCLIGRYGRQYELYRTCREPRR
jgi:hypothetical protein